MIGLFASHDDTKLLNWVESAVQAVGFSPETLTVIEAKYSHDYHLAGRKHGEMIRQMDACIIDVRHKSIIGLAARLGSIGKGLAYETGEREYGEYASPQDSSIALLIRSRKEMTEINHYFGQAYTTISIKNGFGPKKLAFLAAWLRDTVANAAPKIFVCYRSTQSERAKLIAERLRRRGASVWFDKWAIMPGDSIPKEVNRGLGWCTHLVLIVDETFSASKWTTAEVESVLYQHLSGRFRRHYRGLDYDRPIIPLFLMDPASSSLPPMLSRIRGIDIRDPSSIEDAIDRLWTAVTIIGPR